MPWYDGGDNRRREIFELLSEYYQKVIVPQVPNSELVIAGEECYLNRSAMRNACYKKAQGDILFFLDADCYLELEGILHALNLLKDESVGMVQYQRVNWIPENLTQTILSEHDLRYITLQKNHGDVLWGLVYVVRTCDYAEVGGFDERFMKWGEEDPAFQIAIETLIGRVERVPVEYPASHLEHPRSSEHDIKSSSFLRNRRLCDQYRKYKGNKQAMRIITGTTIDGDISGKIHAFASEEHFAEHIAPLFMELYANGNAGNFYILSNVLQKIRYILVAHKFPMSRIVEVFSAAAAKGLLEREKGAVIVAGIGDHRDMENSGRSMILMEHGAGQSYSTRHASYIGGMWRDRTKLVLVPRDECAEQTVKYYPKKAVEAIGCPKLDWYIDKKFDEKTVCISFHWDSSFAPEAKWAFPEYRYKIAELKKYCDSKGIKLIGHCHPRARVDIYPVYKNYGIEIVENFYDVCDRAAVYICDNSSTIFEFAALGRKVILLNSKTYRKGINHGLRFWDKAGVGAIVDSPDQLIDILDKVFYNQVEIDPDIIKTVYNNIGSASISGLVAILRNPSCWENITMVQHNNGMVRVKVNVEFSYMMRSVLPGEELVVDVVEAERLLRTIKRGVSMATPVPVQIDVPKMDRIKNSPSMVNSGETIVPAEYTAEVAAKRTSKRKTLNG